MPRSIANHIRSNVVSYLCLFWLMSGTVLLALPAIAAAVTFSSPFNSNAEGWKTLNTDTCTDATLLNPGWQTAGGNPTGNISASDQVGVFGGVEDCYWYALAPAAVSGNLRANYGGSLAIDLRHPAGADVGGVVNIVDAQGNGLYGESTAAPPAADTWTRYTLGLTETASAVHWYFLPGDGGAERTATKADLFEVLSDVDVVAILGDLGRGTTGEETRFDNFALTQPAVALDSDSDGVTNAADQCPLVAGPASNNGCPLPPPDADADGVPDASDNCRIVAGPASNGGCPLPPADTDGDGVTDPSDGCPNEIGPASNNGCPAPASTNPPETDSPETTMTKRPPKQTDSIKAQFKFSSDEPGTFECKLDRGGFKPCTSPKRLRNLKPGHHTFQVRAVDAAGNTDPTAAKARWTVSD